MSDLISRCELFNRLATIHAPVEANEFKAEIYAVINEMPTEQTERNENSSEKPNNCGEQTERSNADD